MTAVEVTCPASLAPAVQPRGLGAERPKGTCPWAPRTGIRSPLALPHSALRRRSGWATKNHTAKAFFRAFQDAFNDLEFRADQTVADESFVAVRWSMQVNHVGEFAGVAPDGRRVDVNGMVMYRMQDGLIAETWLQIDEAGLLRQIGAAAA